MIVRNVDGMWVVCNYNYIMILPPGMCKDEFEVSNFVHSNIYKSKECFISKGDTSEIQAGTMHTEFSKTSYSRLFGFIDMITIHSIIDTVKVALWNGVLSERVMLKGAQYKENVIARIEDDTVYVELQDEGCDTYPILTIDLDYLELFGKPEISKVISEISKDVRTECHEKAVAIRNNAGYKEFANYLTDCDLTLLNDEGYGELVR